MITIFHILQFYNKSGDVLQDLDGQDIGYWYKHCARVS